MTDATLKHNKQYVIKVEDYPVYELHYNLNSYEELPITKEELEILRKADTYNCRKQIILYRIYNAQDK